MIKVRLDRARTNPHPNTLVVETLGRSTTQMFYSQHLYFRVVTYFFSALTKRLKYRYSVVHRPLNGVVLGIERLEARKLSDTLHLRYLKINSWSGIYCAQKCKTNS